MNLSRTEMQGHFDQWLIAWNNHDIEGVMEFIHDEVVFENWDGRVTSGKTNLKKRIREPVWLNADKPNGMVGSYGILSFDVGQFFGDETIAYFEYIHSAHMSLFAC